jgi:hypothetical protein
MSRDHSGPAAKSDSMTNGVNHLRDQVEYQTILHTQFEKWRMPGGHGAKCPDMGFESLPYVDMLMRDLGLNQYRKSYKTGWMREWLPNPWEWFSMYVPTHYGTINQEWIAKQNAQKKTN